MKAVLAWALFSLALSRAAGSDPYAPLKLYEGAWRLQIGSKPPDEISNRCAQLSTFFVCEQVVNGKRAALITFLPKDQPGQYWTNSLSPDAKANGRGELTIMGDRWVYLGHDIKYYRTVNIFTGRDRIHFESAESDDGEKWVVTNSGEESRVIAAVALPAK